MTSEECVRCGSDNVGLTQVCWACRREEVEAAEAFRHQAEQAQEQADRMAGFARDLGSILELEKEWRSER